MSTEELCRRARLTPREVQWWCEKRIVPFKIIGKKRFFEDSDALVAMTVAELRRKGVGLEQIRRMPLRKLEKEFLVAVHGYRKYRWCTEAELIPFLKQAPGPCLVVAVADLRRQLYE